MPRRKKKARTQRTQERLSRYAKAMGYQEVEHLRDSVLLKHNLSGAEVMIPTTTHGKELGKELWFQLYKELMMRAIYDGKRGSTGEGDQE
jgi:hypothetical protein